MRFEAAYRRKDEAANSLSRDTYLKYQNLNILSRSWLDATTVFTTKPEKVD
jgi:hypothetical protein